MVFRNEPVRVTTVLGSCIAVTMFVGRLKAGAICHALLPVCKEMGVCRERCQNPYKYVECVVPEMIRGLQGYGAGLREIEVKLFGGADMFATSPREGHLSVGRQNIASARRTVAARDLRIKLSDVGDRYGRKIYFFPHTGEVWMKRLGAGPSPGRPVTADRTLQPMGNG